ncbi:MAG: FAD-binding oxidoreductase, partial [Ignavibacteriaceae bacterium]|nr:FAD-binding oxidoreductase [Ignavibacteriaceae bacterium]
MNASIVESIARIVGAQNILTSEEDKIVYSYDGTPLLHQKPEAVVFPETAE